MGELHTEKLFRRRAIQALSQRPFGRPIAAVPKPWLWLTILLVTILLVSGIFLVSADYSRKETVRGWLVARDGVASIRADAAGVVERISAPVGDVVQAGAPLVAISKNTYLADGRSSGQEITRKLRDQVVALDEQIQLLEAAQIIELESIQLQLKSLDAERQVLAREAAEQRSRLRTASEKLARIERATSSGASSAWALLNQQDEHAQLKQLGAQLQQRRIGLDRERQRLAARARTLPLETYRLIAKLSSEKSSMEQKITGQAASESVAFHSPIFGKLTSTEVRMGETVKPNQLLATVMPADMSLIAEVYIPSSAIAFIRPGQTVKLMYDAFPMQRFGTFAGQVARVSDFVMMPNEIPPTFFLREATFKVQITLNAQAVELETGAASLRPGMLLAADIVLERRRLIDWLLEPLRLRRRAPA